MLSLGVDADRFAPDPAAGAAVRAALGVDDDRPLLCFVGNVDPTKDVETLLSAFAGLDADGDAPILLVIGGGDPAYLDSLRRHAAGLGVDDRVRFLGRVDHEDLPGYYNAADVGVWPGKLGVSIIEAVGTGLPVVVCDSEATAFLTAYDNGLVVPRGDAVALRERLSRYLTDPDLRATHAARAAAYARERLSWVKVAERSVELYRGDADAGPADAGAGRAGAERADDRSVRP
jgi:glycosyltransferase involved in cell wall biosynthesis